MQIMLSSCSAQVKGKGTFVASIKYLYNSFISLREHFLSLLNYFWWRINTCSVVVWWQPTSSWIKWSWSLGAWADVPTPILKEWPLESLDKPSLSSNSLICVTNNYMVKGFFSSDKNKCPVSKDSKDYISWKQGN